MNKVNLSKFSAQNFFQIRACVISARKAKHLDVTTTFTYSYANTPLGQSERAYYLSYFKTINISAAHHLVALLRAVRGACNATFRLRFCISSTICRTNRPFYRYGGHIESIRFKEYYRMPRGHEHISFVFSSVFRDIVS